jgi:hypothetical protein
MTTLNLIQVDTLAKGYEFEALLIHPTVVAALIGAGISLLTFFGFVKRELTKINKENLVSTKITSYNDFIDTSTEYNFYKQLEFECSDKLIKEELRIKLQKEVLKIHLYGKKSLVDAAWKVFDYLTTQVVEGQTKKYSDVICEFVAQAREDLNLDEGAFNAGIYSDANLREVRDCCGIRRTSQNYGTSSNSKFE